MKRLLPFLLLALAGPHLAAQETRTELDALETRLTELETLLEQDTGSTSSPWSIGGYGELTYKNASHRPPGMVSTPRDGVDLHRLVLLLGYDFNPVWSFRSEIEVEHGDEVAVEFAQIEAAFHDSLNLRIGHLLIPMGILNPIHEPTTFASAERPLVEQLILPTTWHENGVGLAGSHEELEWEAYVVQAFDADGFDLTASGLRGGRQGAGRAMAEDIALTARLDWRPSPGLQLGGSLYRGDTAQDLTASGFSTTCTCWEGHLQWLEGPLRVRALFAAAQVEDAALLPTASSSEDLQGWYLEGQWDLLQHDPHQALLPFVRFENYDLEVGGASDSLHHAWTAGLAWQPDPGISLKLDYVWFREAADDSADRIEFTLGWSF